MNKYLQDLENRLDDATEDDLFRSWAEFAQGRCTEEVFVPARRTFAPPSLEWPKILINDALDDYDLMALREFAVASAQLAGPGGMILNVRSNYGTSILPSLFGAELFMMDAALNTLPTSRPLGGLDEVRRVVERGVPDLRNGLGGKVLEMGKRFADIAARYPRIGRHVHIYHPDLQGAMDVCEVLWGSALFVDIADDPDLVKAMLEVITDTYIAFMRAWWAVVPPRTDGLGVHWGMVHKGNLMLRSDSAMNFSPRMFDEFIRPYEQKLLGALGGGAVHFCGRGHHYIESMTSMTGLNAVNMSQGHLNDLEIIWKNTVDKNIPLLNFSWPGVDFARANHRPLKGMVHCNARKPGA